MRNEVRNTGGTVGIGFKGKEAAEIGFNTR